MEEFVKNLMHEADLGVLTKRMVRDEYCKVTGKQHLTEEEKNHINQLVYSNLDIALPSKASKRVEIEDKENSCTSSVTSPAKPTKPEKSAKQINQKKNIVNNRNLQLANEKTVLIEKKEKGSNNNKVQNGIVLKKGSNSLRKISSDKLKSPNQSLEEASALQGSGPSPKHSPKLRVDEVLDAVMKSDSESDTSSENENSLNDSDSDLSDSGKLIIAESDSRLNKKTTKTKTKQKQTFKRVKRISSDSELEESLNSDGSSISEKKTKNSSKLKKAQSRKKKIGKKENFRDPDSESNIDDRESDSVKCFEKQNSKHRSKISDHSDSESGNEDWLNKSKNSEVFIDTRKKNSKYLNSDSDSNDSQSDDESQIQRKDRGQKRKLSSQTGSDVSVKPSKKYMKKRSSNVSDNSSSSSEDDQPLSVSRKKNIKEHSSKGGNVSKIEADKKTSEKSAQKSMDKDNNNKIRCFYGKNRVKEKTVLKVRCDMSSDSDNSEDELPLSSVKTESMTTNRSESFDKIENTFDDDTKKLNDGAMLSTEKLSSDDESSSEDELPLSSFRNSSVSDQSKIKSVSSYVGSSDSENDAIKNKSNKPKKVMSSSSSDCSDSEEEVLKEKTTLKKTSNKKENRKVLNDSSSDTDSESVIEQSKKKSKVNGKENKQKAKPVKKSPKTVEEESTHVKNLKKICRASGIIIRNTRELEGCVTDNQKVKRLKDILSNAGMTGQPSMKKAERLKLKKEAAELDTENIISTNNGRRRRNVNSVFSRRQKSPTPDLLGTPIKQKFSRLKDIIDSEGSSG